MMTRSQEERKGGREKEGGKEGEREKEGKRGAIWKMILGNDLESNH